MSLLSINSLSSNGFLYLLLKKHVLILLLLHWCPCTSWVQAVKKGTVKVQCSVDSLHYITTIKIWTCSVITKSFGCRFCIVLRKISILGVLHKKRAINDESGLKIYMHWSCLSLKPLYEIPLTYVYCSLQIDKCWSCWWDSPSRFIISGEGRMQLQNRCNYNSIFCRHKQVFEIVNFEFANFGLICKGKCNFPASVIKWKLIWSDTSFFSWILVNFQMGWTSMIFLWSL
jgi:hypothetical protein